MVKQYLRSVPRLHGKRKIKISNKNVHILTNDPASKKSKSKQHKHKKKKVEKRQKPRKKNAIEQICDRLDEIGKNLNK